MTDRSTLRLWPEESPIPQLELRGDGTVCRANAAARRAGLTEGISLLLYLSEEEQTYHRACLTRQPGCDVDPLRHTQGIAVFRLRELPPYTLCHLRYLHTLKSAVLYAALFVTRRDCRRYGMEVLPRREDPLRGDGWRALLTDGEARDMDRRLCAAALRLPTAVGMGGGAHSPLYNLCRVMDMFVGEVIPHLYPLDARLCIAPLPQEGVYAYLEPLSFFLLLSVLLCAMDALSEDRVIALALKPPGSESGVELGTGCARLAGISLGSADLYVLSTVTPMRQPLWSLAEKLLCDGGHDVHIHAFGHNGVAVRLLTPTVAVPSLFQSAAREETALLAAARQLGALLDTQKKQQNHDHIHGPLVLRTEEEEQADQQ